MPGRAKLFDNEVAKIAEGIEIERMQAAQYGQVFPVSNFLEIDGAEHSNSTRDEVFLIQMILACSGRFIPRRLSAASRISRTVSKSMGVAANAGIPTAREVTLVALVSVFLRSRERTNSACPTPVALPWDSG